MRKKEVVSNKWDHLCYQNIPHLLRTLRNCTNMFVEYWCKTEKSLRAYAGLLIRDLIKTTPARIASPFEFGVDWISVKAYREELALYSQVLLQEHPAKRKIYSLNDLTIHCTGKCVSHKKWGTDEQSGDKPSEVRSLRRKASVAVTRFSRSFVEAVSFEENILNGDILAMGLLYTCGIREKELERAQMHRGFRGRHSVRGVDHCGSGTFTIVVLYRMKAGSYYHKCRKWLRFFGKSAIEPVISMLDVTQRSLRLLLMDFPLVRCFLKGAVWGRHYPIRAEWMIESVYWDKIVCLLRTLTSGLWVSHGTYFSPKRHPIEYYVETTYL